MGKWSMKPRHSITILLTVAALMVGWSHGLSAQPQPAGELVIAWPFTIAPAWFDPAETPPQITPFGILYALHDGLVRPLPGERMGNSLAVSWTESDLRSLSRMEQATQAGRVLAQRAKDNGIERAVFDRGGYKYHGRVRALAEGAREAGLTV